MNIVRLLGALLVLLSAFPAAAEITESGENGFTVSHSITTEVEPFIAYRTMTSHIDQWWSGDHSWSGDAGNFFMELERGGGFCERLPNGGHVEHLRIIYLAPGSEIRFDGALGPLQTMATQGRMIWKIEPVEGGSKISFTYHVFGHPAGGLGGISAAVDRVIGEQLALLGERLTWN
jgi:hypothetical protein